MCKIGLALLTVLLLANRAPVYAGPGAGLIPAYVGPGAGLELIPYAVGLIILGGTFIFSILLWPFYALRRWMRGRAKAPTVPPTPASMGETGADSKVHP